MAVDKNWMLSVVISVSVIVGVLFIILGIVVIYCVCCRRRREAMLDSKSPMKSPVIDDDSSSLSSFGKSRGSYTTGSARFSDRFAHAQSGRKYLTMPARNVNYPPPWLWRYNSKTSSRNTNPVRRYKVKRTGHTSRQARSVGAPSSQSVGPGNRSLQLNISQNYNRHQFRPEMNYFEMMTSRSKSTKPVYVNQVDSGPIHYSNHQMEPQINRPVHYSPRQVETQSNSPIRYSDPDVETHHSIIDGGIKVTTISNKDVLYSYTGNTSEHRTTDMTEDARNDNFRVLDTSLPVEPSLQHGDTWRIMGPVLTSDRVVNTSERLSGASTAEVVSYPSDMGSVLW